MKPEFIKGYLPKDNIYNTLDPQKIEYERVNPLDNPEFIQCCLNCKKNPVLCKGTCFENSGREYRNKVKRIATYSFEGKTVSEIAKIESVTEESVIQYMKTKQFYEYIKKFKKDAGKK